MAEAEAEIQKQIDKDNEEEAAELKEVADAKNVSEAGEVPMSGAMQAAKQAAIDEKEEKQELAEVAEKDVVNEDSKKAMGDMLAEKMEKQKMDNKAEADEAAELKEVAEAKKVSEAGEMPMSGAMQAAKQAAIDEKEDKQELADIAEKDLVNEDSKKAMGDMLAGKMEKQAEEEIQTQVDKDNEEEAAELEEVAEAKKVSEAEPVPMSGAMQAAKQAAIDEKEEKQELAEIAEKDLVNEDSKKSMGDMLAEKMEKEKRQAEEGIQTQIDKDNEEEAAELEEVADAKKLSEAEPVPMSGAMQAAKQAAIDEEEVGDVAAEEEMSIKGRLLAGKIMPDVLKETCDAMVTITYGDNVVESEEKVLTPTQTKEMPNVSWKGEEGTLYTVVMTDPDAISRQNPLFREFVHYAAVNVTGSEISADSDVNVALQYAGPGPPYNSGLHRYVWLVYAQTVEADCDDLSKYLEGRGGKKVDEWCREKGMTLTAANFYEAEWDESVDDNHKNILGFLPPPEYRSPAQKAEVAAEEQRQKEEDEKQEKQELAEIAEKDLVNEDSKKAMGDMLAEKMEKEKKQAEQEIQTQIDKDNKKEAAELEEVAAAKKVSEAEPVPMSGAMQAAKQAAMDDKEEAAELEEVAAAKKVSKAEPVPMSGAMQVAKQAAMDNKEETAELEEVAAAKKVSEAEPVPMSGAMQAAKQAAMDNKEEAAELEEVAAAKKVSEAEPVPMSGAMQAAKQAAMDEKEEKQELAEIAEKDLVNEDSKKEMGDMLAEKMEKEKKQAEEDIQTQIDKDNKEEAAELEEVAEAKKVSEAEPVPMSGAMQAAKQATIDEKEEKQELAEVAEKDLVNKDSKKAMGDMLAEKMEKQKMDNKAEADKAAELKEVAEAKKVSEAEPVPMPGAMQAAKQQAIDAKEEKEELDDLKEKDLVNEDSKSAMAEIVEKKKAKDAEAAEEEEMEEEVDAASPAAKSPVVSSEYDKTKVIYIAKAVKAEMQKLYSDDGCRHVIIRVDEKKKKGRKKYYAELASSGDDNLGAVLSTIESDPNQIYFSFIQIDTTDASGSNRTKYCFSQYMGSNVGATTRAKVMSYLGELKKMCSKEDMSVMGVDTDNYKEEYTPKNLSTQLHRSGSHKPDCYLFGSLGEYRM